MVSSLFVRFIHSYSSTNDWWSIGHRTLTNVKIQIQLCTNDRRWVYEYYSFRKHHLTNPCDLNKLLVKYQTPLQIFETRRYFTFWSTLKIYRFSSCNGIWISKRLDDAPAPLQLNPTKSLVESNTSCVFSARRITSQNLIDSYAVGDLPAETWRSTRKPSNRQTIQVFETRNDSKSW